jgi:hypothetical protein
MQRTFDSADYKPATLSASSIGETGEEMVYLGIEEHETKFGPGKNCFVACIKHDKYEAMIFSSKKLAQLLRENSEVLMGKRIRVRGISTGVERTYKVDLLE